MLRVAIVSFCLLIGALAIWPQCNRFEFDRSAVGLMYSTTNDWQQYAFKYGYYDKKTPHKGRVIQQQQQQQQQSFFVCAFVFKRRLFHLYRYPTS